VASVQRIVVRPENVLDVASGELESDRAVVVADGRILDVIAADDADRSGSEVVELDGQTLLPGLIDCHAHLVGEPDGGHGYAEILTRTGAQEAMAGVRNARDTVLAGFTTVRDVGTLRAFVDVALRDAIEAGWVIGPRMRCAGGYITSSDGGGSVGGLAPDVDPGVPADFKVGVVDSVDDVRRAVRRLVHGGADVIKVIATGAVMTTGGVPGAPELTLEQLQAAVEEAALYGVDVAAHAHGAEGIKRAVRAGVRSIEHGSLMDDQAIAMMADAGTFLVADIYSGDYIAEVGGAQGWGADVLRKNEETMTAQREGFEKCVAAGVKIAFGTDSGIYPHGWNARQLAYHVRWGQSPIDAIRSASLHAAELLRWDDRIGRIAGGYLADMIAVEGNPLDDVRLLEDVSFVMSRGAILQRP
jgi:imidazolonepropionase-like amidohydrolase